jgi:hypothetical protein
MSNERAVKNESCLNERVRPMKPLWMLLAFLPALGGTSSFIVIEQDVKGQVLSYGLAKSVGQQEQEGNPGTPTDLRRIEGLVIAAKTSIITAKKGAQFGLTYSVSGLPPDEIVNIRRITIHPAFRLPDGKILTEHKSDTKLQTTAAGTLSTFFGWEFTDDFEFVTGNWREEIWYGDKKLVEHWFRIVVESEKGEVGRDPTEQGKPATVSAKDLPLLWTELDSPEFEKADNAWRKLNAAGHDGISFLGQQILKVAILKADLVAMEKLVAEVDSADFKTRERAVKELIGLGEPSIVPLQRLLERNPSPEAKERATALLKTLGEPALTPERKRASVAIELLEYSHTAKGVTLLKEIEREALVPQLRLQAFEALGRLASSNKE